MRMLSDKMGGGVWVGGVSFMPYYIYITTYMWHLQKCRDKTYNLFLEPLRIYLVVVSPSQKSPKILNTLLFSIPQQLSFLFIYHKKIKFSYGKNFVTNTMVLKFPTDRTVIVDKVFYVLELQASLYCIVGWILKLFFLLNTLTIMTKGSLFSTEQ